MAERGVKRAIEDDVVSAQARHRALGLLDFLSGYYGLTHPPVHDVAAYGDYRLRASELPRGPGVTLSPGGPAWLSADLIAQAPTPEPPSGVSAWIGQAPLTARQEPALVVPDGLAALVALGDDPEVDLEALTTADLEAAGVTGLDPSAVDLSTYIVERLEDIDRARALVGDWVEAIWRPWATKWVEIARTRAFYKQLFDVRSRTERDRDLIEVVWGFGRLRWQPELDQAKRLPVVDHPLVTVPVELALDPDTGRLTVGPAGPPDVEMTFCDGLPVADRMSLSDQRRSAADIEIDPWGEEFAGLARALLRAIDHDGVVLDDATTASAQRGSPARMEIGDWILYIRRRQPDFRGFLEEQRALYADPANKIPDPFASLVIDEPSVLDRDLDVDHSRLLLPLPANTEQHQILRLAQTRAGVTAQGPPGTGKSHTIANLVSHYVAHGKRVLVTAEKEQALGVLADKIPAGIRDLCVSVMGADEVSRRRLERTISAIQAGVSNTYDPGEVARLAQHLDSIDAKAAATANELTQRRSAEAQPAPHPEEAGAATRPEWTPSHLAAWLTANEHHGWIADPLVVDIDCPLSVAEVAELVRLVSEIAPADADASRAHLPDTVTVPAGAALAAEEAELGDLRALLAGVEDVVTDWSTVDRCDHTTLAELAEEVEAAATWLEQTDSSWLGRVLHELNDPSLAAAWGSFHAESAVEREGALTSRRALAAHELTSDTPDIPDVADIQALRDARDRFAAGKGVGLFHRAERRALDAWRIDGRVPDTAETVELVLAEIEGRTQRRRLRNRWINSVARVDGPTLDAEDHPEDRIGEELGLLGCVLLWLPERWPALRRELAAAGVATPEVPSLTDLRHLVSACRTLGRRARERHLTARREQLLHEMETGSAGAGASPLWTLLTSAVRDRRWDTVDRLRAELDRLATIRPRAERLGLLADHLTTAAPAWAAAIRAGTPGAVPDLSAVGTAWRWRQLERWHVRLSHGRTPDELQAALEQLAQDRLRVVRDLVEAMAWTNLKANFTDRNRAALNRFTTANTKLGKATGKYAGRWQAEIRAALDDAKDAVPVWIMPIHRIVSSFRPAAEPPFDVLIVDEASQVGLLEIPVLGLARTAIVVGDDQQTSPENVGTNLQGVYDLIDEHLRDIRDRRTQFDPNNSLYDIARQKFPQVVQLREHFRSLPDIIGFSNRRYYGNSIIPLRDRPPRPGWPSLGTVFVPEGHRNPADDTNEPEAQAVVDLIDGLISDPDYDGMDFGVITLLGTGQAPLIQSLLVDRLGPQTMEERRIRVGTPANFQGDERDVMVLSYVVALDPSGSRMGAMTKRTDERRLNVAASRAKNQLWLVHSVQAEAFHPDDPRGALLRHCSEPAEVNEAVKALAEECDSQFERDVLARIVARGYRSVLAQHRVGGYRIDLVVEGPESRLAVECDGDFWHGPERWDSDRSRQAVLERAGWTFCRIRGSSFYRDPEAALQSLWSRLDELGIPTGEWADTGDRTPASRTWLSPVKAGDGSDGAPTGSSRLSPMTV
jgi:very-short-patch-repair endonuclease